ncbi:hypothetical protein CLIB1444_16S00276 [[Candida] jaroonii]|uniref:Uncharacterized protein n=1 Tax=[Candida] jaroonii TaxID=467808 RepID=A0ACA9YFT2_9ASCO|nr:hypothetical protein CLIB1444_16S00276 [[Candida] jaroonii]
MDLPIVHIRNLPYDTSSTSLFELFEDYDVHSIRTKPGSCFVILKQMKNAQAAVEKLNGINFNGRYIICGIFNAHIDNKDLLTEDTLKLIDNYQA